MLVTASEHKQEPNHEARGNPRAMLASDRMGRVAGRRKVAWNGTPRRVTAPFHFCPVIQHTLSDSMSRAVWDCSPKTGRYTSPKAKYMAQDR